MKHPVYPTPWQRQVLWAALATLAVVAIGAVAVGLVWIVSRVLGFLQPILIPFAIAGVMAYLLDPVVAKIVAWGTTRQRAVLAVFAIVTLALGGVAIWIVPEITHQTANLVRRVPRYSQKVKTLIVDFTNTVQTKTGLLLVPQKPAVNGDTVSNPAETRLMAEPPGEQTPLDPLPPEGEEAIMEPATLPPTPEIVPGTAAAIARSDYEWNQLVTGDWVKNALPAVLRNLWAFIATSVGGFLGFFGFLLSMVIVPVYLYYFLIESRNIASSWGDYLPLRASALKDEVVSALNEINGYLIAFFRGQLLVNGTATGILLMAVGADFGLLIGLMLCILGIIPYLGIILCWVPAVVIASVQGGSWLIPAQPWWIMPLVVTGIFTVVQQVDGLFITPKIVGESVGLHPMTVIVSVFVWSLLMGGLLGAILAVPMTATLKVLLRRYVWTRRFRRKRRTNVEEAEGASAEEVGAEPLPIR
jgi:predicted PurR-regulated permease PerM